MKKLVILGAAAAMALVSVAPAQTVVQNFDALTADASIGTAWRPGFSGTSTASIVADATDAETVSTEQAQSGTQSGKLTWTWANASGGAVRVQPTSGVETGPTDHTAEPYFSIAYFGTNSSMTIQPYMCEVNNGTYEAFVDQVTDDANGWRTIEYNITTAAIVGWVNGDGTLNASCEWCGIFFRQGSSTGLQTVYLDDIQYSATPLASSSVGDWSLVKY